MSGVIVHEWLESFGGAEMVMDRFAALYPDAPIYSLWNDAPERFERARVNETWLARTPLRGRKALAVPLMPLTWRTLGKIDAEWILCSSHLFSHHARFGGAGRTAPKYVYVHSPARYIWAPELDERGNSPLVRLAAPPFRRLDKKRAAEISSAAANSGFVSERIRNTWGIDSEVIYPPVEVARFTGRTELTEGDAGILDTLPADYLLGASRFVKYKRLDLVIRAGKATGVPVVLAGAGPDKEKLEHLAAELDVSVTFVHRPSHGLLVELYRRSIAYVFPAIEDFGIMPVEAMATGTPVIGPRVGGVAETVVDGVTGALIEDFGGEDIRAAVTAVAGLEAAPVVERAWEFDVARFDARVREWLPEAAG